MRVHLSDTVQRSHWMFSRLAHGAPNGQTSATLHNMPIHSHRPRTAAALAVFAAFAAASLTACGGGGGGDDSPATPPVTETPAPAPSPSPAPAPTPSPAPAPSPTPSGSSSAACINAADYNEGTVVVEEGVTKGNGPSDYTTVSTVTTGGRQNFAGANPVTFTPQSTGSLGNNREFRDLVAGNEVAYGGISDVDTQVTTWVYEPPVTSPIDMQPGQVHARAYKQKSTVVAKAPGGATTLVEDSVEDRYTYVGRELLPTALGTLNVCKFSNAKTTVRANESSKTTFEIWTVAEGPYRGRTVRIKTTADVAGTSSTYDVTKITYTPK